MVTDHFTHYGQAYVTKSQTALMTAKALWDTFIVHYGLPEKILSDQGRNFKCELIADLCRLMGTWKLRTSLTILEQMANVRGSVLPGWYAGTLSPERKSDWKGSIGALVHTYNCILNSAMGFSPYFLMYGRELHLPLTPPKG